MEYWLAAITYMIGCLFMVMNFAPTEDASGRDYLLLVFFWPLLTLWNVLSDLLGFTHEED